MNKNCKLKNMESTKKEKRMLNLIKPIYFGTVRKLLSPFGGAGGCFTLLALMLTFNCVAQSWLPLGLGTNNTVFAMAADTINNVLYVGGKFTTAGGQTNNYVAKWDGNSWQNIGANFNARIYYLGIFNGELYATGDFTTIDGDTVNHVAKWNGTNWVGFGSGVDGTTYVAEMHNGELYIGGSFLMSGSQPVSKIAKWDGIQWQPVGGGTNARVRALKSYNGLLYVGGNFTQVGNPMIAANRIAVWNDTNWTTLSSGMDFEVFDLEIYQNQLHAAGWFSPSPAKYIAKWNGANWSAVGGGTNGRIEDMIVFNNELYITGTFTTVGAIGLPANRIAKWNGSTWGALGSGLTGLATAEGYTLAIFQNTIYAGGEFNTAGNNPSNNIAMWGISTGFQDNLIYKSKELELFPIPANHSLTIINPFFENNSSNTQLQIKNVFGQIVFQEDINKEKIKTIEINGLSNGWYALTLSNGKNNQTKPILISK